MGDKAGVISAVIAAATALAAGANWGWQQLSGPDDPPAADAATTAPPASAASDPSPPPATASASTAPPAAGSGTPLDTVERIGGAVVALPDDVTAADYSRPVAVECPSNQTGDQTRTLTYDLDRRFRTFTTTVSGWAETADADAIEVRVYTKIRQQDDTFRTVQAGLQGGVVNRTGRALSVKVTGADQMLVEVGCHRPEGVVILDAAMLGS